MIAPTMPMPADTRLPGPPGAPPLTGAGRPEPDLSFHGDRELADGLTDLAVNVRPGTPPPWLLDRIRAATGDLAAYPDPRAATEAAARRHARPPAEVLVTAGAAEAFTLIARAFRPRRAVIVHPQFTEPEAALRAAGHPVHRVTLGGDFTLDPGAVPQDADLVVVGNPTNPTSVLHPAAAIRALARPGRLLLLDEAFADCVPGEPESLAGLRAGYLLAGPAHVRALARPRPPWAVSGPALAAVVACCAPPATAEAAAWATAMSAERSRLGQSLNHVPGVAVTPHARASFLLLNVPSVASVRERLRAARFAVRRGDTFPGLGPGWIRIAVRDRATNDRFAAALSQVLQEVP
jgi:histidinol-phosphate aminotransferase